MRTLANQANRWVEKPDTGQSDFDKTYEINQQPGNYQPIPTLVGLARSGGLSTKSRLL